MRLGHVQEIIKWLDNFEKVKVLGVGATGIVYELKHKQTGRRFALKEMEIKNKAQMQMALSEAEMLKEIMENISHPNIMHIDKVFQVGLKFYLVFPLCTGGELYEHVIRRGHFSERDAAVIMRDLMSGLHGEWDQMIGQKWIGELCRIDIEYGRCSTGSALCTIPHAVVTPCCIVSSVASGPAAFSMLCTVLYF